MTNQVKVGLTELHNADPTWGADNPTLHTVANYGTPAGQNNEYESASVIGSHLPYGRLVVYSARTDADVTGRIREVHLPDREGDYLTYPDEVTSFKDVAKDALDKDGNFHFVGLSMMPIKRDCVDRSCSKPTCCPIGYPDDHNRWSYYDQRSTAEVLVEGKGNAYAEVDLSTKETVLYARVAITDKEVLPCQLLGGITNKADKGTQAMGSNVRVVQSAEAGSRVLIHLSGMSSL